MTRIYMLAICDDEFQISFQYSNDIHEIDTKLTSLVIEQRWKMDETKEFSHDWLITPWIINQSVGRSIFLCSLSLPSFYWDISLSTFVNHRVDRWDWAIGDKINCRTKSIDNSVFFFWLQSQCLSVEKIIKLIIFCFVVIILCRSQTHQKRE